MKQSTDQSPHARCPQAELRIRHIDLKARRLLTWIARLDDQSLLGMRANQNMAVESREVRHQGPPMMSASALKVKVKTGLDIARTHSKSH